MAASMPVSPSKLKVIMCVVPVVDDADILVPPRAQLLADGDQVLRFASPATVVVEAQFASELRAAPGEPPIASAAADHLLSLIAVTRARGGVPDLGWISYSRTVRRPHAAPEREEFDAVLLVLDDLFLELRHM